MKELVLLKVLTGLFRHVLSGTLTQSIRNFAKSLESWLAMAMADCPREMTVIKVSLLIFKILE